MQSARTTTSSRSDYTLQGVAWIAIYLILVLAPLLVLLLGPRPPGRGFWRELSVALGFVGLAILVLNFALTARIRTIGAPYGIDIVYHFHRQISIVAVLLILAHPIILFVNTPAMLRLLNLLEAPWRARYGVTATILLVMTVSIALLRRQFGIGYMLWRIAHGLVGIAVVVLAAAHVYLVGNYISTPWQQALWSGYAAFWVCLLLYVRVVQPMMTLRRPYLVDQVIPERGECWTLVLRPDGHSGISFEPGQFAWLTAWRSPFLDTEHPFSFSSSASDAERLALTIKELGSFTRKIKHLQPGQRVYLDGPFGAFSIDRYPRASGYVFIAGGIGITPIMSMLRTMADRGDRRPIRLLYGNKDWESVSFREEISALEKRLDLRVVHVLESPPEGWDGEVGYITRDILDRHLCCDEGLEHQEIFVCGPERMTDAVQRLLHQLGIHPTRIIYERFDLV